MALTNDEIANEVMEAIDTDDASRIANLRLLFQRLDKKMEDAERDIDRRRAAERRKQYPNEHMPTKEEWAGRV